MAQIQIRQIGPIQFIRGGFEDFDDFAAVTNNWDLDFVQLDRGPSPVDAIQVISKQAHIMRFHFGRSFEQRGCSPKGTLNFGIPDISKPLRFGQRTTPSTALICFAPGNEFSAVSPAGFTGTTLSFNTGHLTQVADDLKLAVALEEAEELGLRIGIDHHTQKRLALIVDKLLTLAGGLGEDPPLHALAKYIEEVIPEHLIETLATIQDAKDRRLPSRLRDLALRRSVAFIDNHAHEAPPIRRICRAAGASWRTLDYAFKEHFGITPKAYLHAVRMQKVRNLIKGRHGEEFIADIAGRWGFWHMGQFAADYRRMFGELPSATSFKRPIKPQSGWFPR